MGLFKKIGKGLGKIFKPLAQAFGGPLAPIVTAFTTNDGGVDKGKINWKSPDLWGRIILGGLAGYVIIKGLLTIQQIAEILEVVGIN